jgi:hypothetical protein
MLDLEVLWAFHTSFFYLGVRRWVYRLPVPDDLDGIIESRVTAFLTGAVAEFCGRRRLVSTPVARKRKSVARSRGAKRAKVRAGTFEKTSE